MNADCCALPGGPIVAGGPAIEFRPFGVPTSDCQSHAARNEERRCTSTAGGNEQTPPAVPIARRSQGPVPNRIQASSPKNNVGRAVHAKTARRQFRVGQDPAYIPVECFILDGKGTSHDTSGQKMVLLLLCGRDVLCVRVGTGCRAFFLDGRRQRPGQ